MTIISLIKGEAIIGKLSSTWSSTRMNPAALKHLEAVFIYGYISLSSIKCVYLVSSQNHLSLLHIYGI